jgi:hypothetical protein
MHLETLIVAAGAAFGGFAQGLSGFAFGLIALSIWVWVLDPTLLAPLIVFGSLAGQFATAGILRHAWKPSLFLPCVVGGALGVPFGVALLRWVDPLAFKIGVGVLLVLWCPTMLLVRDLPCAHSLGPGAGLGPPHAARRLPNIQSVHAVPDHGRLCVLASGHAPTVAAACRDAAGHVDRLAHRQPPLLPDQRSGLQPRHSRIAVGLGRHPDSLVAREIVVTLPDRRRASRPTGRPVPARSCLPRVARHNLSSVSGIAIGDPIGQCVAGGRRGADMAAFARPLTSNGLVAAGTGWPSRSIAHRSSVCGIA